MLTASNPWFLLFLPWVWALLFGGMLLGACVAHAQEIGVGSRSPLAQLVPAESLERAAQRQYLQMLQEAARQKALAGAGNGQLIRLRSIAQRLIPVAVPWNERSRDWQWEVNLIGSEQVNAFCMPGGKIVFYTGILRKLRLTDDEVAMVMGHEMAHALREHARERMAKSELTGLGVNAASQLFGLGAVGQTVTQFGARLLTLTFSRADETEADLVGMELAARAGFDPRAGISLWHKMAQASRGGPPQWLSTHPSNSTRIAEMQANLPKVVPLYEAARVAPPGVPAPPAVPRQPGALTAPGNSAPHPALPPPGWQTLPGH